MLLELIPQVPTRYHAIAIIIAGFVANFVVFGIGFTFGVFQEFYTSDKGPLVNTSHAVVSMIGTTATATTYCCAIFFNTAMNYLKSPQTVMFIGSMLMGLGLLTASFCQTDNAYQFILSQGLLFGIGASFTYIPPVVCAPPFFTRHRGVALGILFSGTGAGALVLGPITRTLISHIGWRWCLRILAFISIFVTGGSSVLVNQHSSLQSASPTSSLKKIFDIRLMSVDPISLYTQLFAGFFQSAGYLISLNYMSTYGETLGFSATQGTVFIALNNGINAIFKVILGFLADKYIGRLNMIIICNLMSTLCVLILWMISLRGTFITFVVLYGVFSGAIISLLPTCLSEIFGIKNYKSMSGLMYFFRGIGNFLGSPIAGLLISTGGQPTDYQNCIIYNGCLLGVSTFLLTLLKVRVRKTVEEQEWREN